MYETVCWQRVPDQVKCRYKFNTKLAEEKPKTGSTLAAVFGERKSALLRRIAAWRQLQHSHMPGVQVLIGPEDIETEDVETGGEILG